MTHLSNEQWCGQPKGRHKGWQQTYNDHIGLSGNLNGLSLWTFFLWDPLVACSDAGGSSVGSSKRTTKLNTRNRKLRILMIWSFCSYSIGSPNSDFWRRMLASRLSRFYIFVFSFFRHSPQFRPNCLNLVYLAAFALERSFFHLFLFRVNLCLCRLLQVCFKKWILFALCQAQARFGTDYFNCDCYFVFLPSNRDSELGL